MIDIVYKPLSFFLEMIKKNTPFSFARYWDGEIACMIGRQGMNCDGCRYTEELRIALCKTIENNLPYYHALYFPSMHSGTVNLRKSFVEYLKSIKSKISWFDSMIWQRSFEQHNFHQIINALKGKNVVFVAGDHLRKAADRVGAHFIEVPRIDAFAKHDAIEKQIRNFVYEQRESPILIFCAGMASNVMIDNLFPVIGDRSFMLDMGSVWDAFSGLKTRQWIRRVANG